MKYNEVINSSSLVPYDLIIGSDFVKQDAKKLMCAMCKGILLQPVYCEACLEKFCNGCAQGKCSKCKSNKINDCPVMIKNKLAQLKLRCLKCEKTGGYQYIITHIKHCGETSKYRLEPRKIKDSEVLSIIENDVNTEKQLISSIINTITEFEQKCKSNGKYIESIESKIIQIDGCLQRICAKLK